jgi:aryl-alcohol dehydrogenase-like predicted oxidoreductase
MGSTKGSEYMQYKHLGRSGLKVSPICLGTMNFGPLTTEADGFAIMDKALEVGINFFDTADVYGWKKGEGVTEQIVGRWFAQGGSRRERVVIATKVFGDMDAEGKIDPNMVRGLSARKIKMACENSLKRLQTDHIDLYQMHHIDRDCPFDEIWQAYETLIQQGKVIYAGSSNFAGWDIAMANMSARHRNFLGLVSEQSVYHLENRMVELEVVPACRHFGLGIIPWSPLGGGLLGGALQKRKEGRRGNEGFEKRVEAKRPQLEKYEALCKELGEEPANVALAWLLHNPTVTAPIIGPRTMEQLTGVLKVPDIKLSIETMAKLNEIWPGPGGEAPKAYAW